MTSPSHSVVIHAHFYQPPREDPWLDEVPREPSAAPYHDWNTRIERECYRAVAAARVLGREGRIAHIVNTLTSISFDLCPTLAGWLEQTAPDTYRAFLDGDRVSCARNAGHGNALAAPFHHVILPLSTRRDKRTEILWGLADFRRRFGRESEGCWLPETAVDDETLDVLAECGVGFTILAPHQIEGAPTDGTPGRYRTAGERAIALCVYDGPLSHDVAFGPLITDSHRWAEAMVSGSKHLVSIATDGETYGHHHRFGEMALAAALQQLEAAPGARVENFAAYLADHPATTDVQLRAPSSWSCAHGIERWRSECGCRLDGAKWPSQSWRRPLRVALEHLQRALHDRFERDGAGLFGDPWQARDAYGDVLAGAMPLADWLAHWAPTADAAGRQRAAELLEMERHALGMLTSCGWFFDDISGLESLQVLRYAAHAIRLSGPGGDALERDLLTVLEDAASNDPAVGTGRDLYERSVRTPLGAAPRIAAAIAAAVAVGVNPTDAVPDAFIVEPVEGAVRVIDRRTGRTERVVPAVERTRPGRLEVRVSADGSPTVGVPLTTLPERAGDAIRQRLAQEVADLWFTDDETAAICRGIPPLHVAEQAVRRAIVALADGANPLAGAQVLDLLDLFELQGAPVPFDAQTMFAAIRDRLPVAAEYVSTIATRLGFV
jgi:Domain of unknown function (DUF3536)/Glycosyl hydrolase family 57